MKRSLFDIIRNDLQIAIEGYYAKEEDRPTDKEAKTIFRLLIPHLRNEVFTEGIDVVTLFCILFASIRVIKKKSSWLYQLEKHSKQNAIPYSQIKKIAAILDKRKSNILSIKEDSIKEVTFSFHNGESIKLEGSMTDFLFEMIFAMLTQMDDTKLESGKKGFPIELSGFLYFKGEYDKIKARGKRSYNNVLSLSKADFDRDTIKKVCKGLHNFLSKYSILIPNGKKTSSKELTLIQEFIWLTDYKADLEIKAIRNLIVRE